MIDSNSDEAIIARHRDYFRAVHPDIKNAALIDAYKKQSELINCQSLLNISIKHLDAILNDCSNENEKKAAYADAKDWLKSIK